jgi:hypothetical protein
MFSRAIIRNLQAISVLSCQDGDVRTTSSFERMVPAMSVGCY